MIAPTSDAFAARLPRWTNTALVVAIGVALAATAVKLLPADAVVPSGPVAAAGTGASSAVDPLERARATASLHVFGDAAKAPARAAAPVEAPKKETSLNLQLAGVYAADPQSMAVAIISSGSAEQNAYGVGDRISSEVVLKGVYPDYVVIANRGTDEILKLPDDVAPIATTPIQSASYDARSQRQSSSASAGQDLSQPLELPSNPGQLRDTLARNPSMLGRVVAAEPYQENGKLVGYRITPKQNPEILEAQGIVAGDVITRVNDIQLNSQKQGIRALRNAVKAESLAVTVLRDGVEIPINISLSQ